VSSVAQRRWELTVTRPTSGTGAAEPIDAVIQEPEVPAQLRHRFRGPVGLDQVVAGSRIDI